jgi:hypothetical protein
MRQGQGEIDGRVAFPDWWHFWVAQACISECAYRWSSVHSHPEVGGVGQVWAKVTAILTWRRQLGLVVGIVRRIGVRLLLPGRRRFQVVIATMVLGSDDVG